MDCISYLWSSKPFTNSYFLATFLCIVPISVNTPGRYDLPVWCFALSRCAIHFHVYFLWLQHLYWDLAGYVKLSFGDIVVWDCYLNLYLLIWRFGCCCCPELDFLCPWTCLNVGLARADQFLPCGVPHQNLSQVDWCNNNFFNYFVQVIACVLTVIGTNALDQLLPLCSHLISHCLVAISKDVVT